MATVLSIQQRMPSSSVVDDPRWAHVVSRDKTADGLFWYSVATTGVYCRPSCPSRAANPKNVQLHDSLDSARAAGFRPCKRCKPDAFGIESENAVLVARACRLIESGEEAPSLDELARAVGRSASHFHRIFKAVTGITPKAYAAGHRAAKVRQRLQPGSRITQTIYDAGFGSSGHFYEKSTAMLGMKPTQYRDGGANEQIYFAAGETSLGSILVASSKQGVVSILLGDDPHELLCDLQDRFANAQLVGADSHYESLVASVVGLVEAPGLGLDLPLDVRGTVFQHRVWRALRDIPAGDAVSYAEVAKRIGSPKAVRAVAGACAANHLAIAIPCHRVVRNDGSLSGYAWGVERKRSLLERESTQRSGQAPSGNAIPARSPEVRAAARRNKRR